MVVRRIIAVLTLALGLTLGLLTALGPFSSVQAAPGDLFVRPDGSGTACSQASPCALQTALARASDGDTLYLAGGTYTGTGAAVITVTKSITLYGGWNGASSGPVVRNPNAYPTTIDGEGARRGVVVGSNITVTLEGFTITNGVDAFRGAGLYARDAHLTLRHVVVYSNVIDVYDTPDTYAYGSGAMVEGGTVVVEASTFRANSAWAQRASFGGGLAISRTVAATVTGALFQDNDAWQASGLYFLGDPGGRPPLTLRESTFVGNGRGNSPGRAWGGYAGAMEVAYARAHLEGNTIRDSRASNDDGALAIFSSNVLLARNVIIGNQCGRTSALYLHNTAPFTVTNNIIAGNRSTISALPDTPAVRVGGGSGRFLHNTIARNDSDYGVRVEGGAGVWLTNTILVSHTVGISVTAGSTATLEGTLWGSGAWANGADWGGAGTILTGTVNIWGHPAFVDPGGGNYHLGPGSAAIDAGVDAGVTADIDGDPRPIGAGYDIGADEATVWQSIYLPLVLRND